LCHCNIEIPEALLTSLLAKLVNGILACSEDDANVTAAGAARFVHDSLVSRETNEFLVTCIKYAELMVNTETSKRIDVGRK
jgi:hypothetical protein